MSQIIEIAVPDIGNFDSVDVIEVLVKPGDSIGVDDSLITLESDKASMDIPSTHAGTVKAVTVKVGDKVSKGSSILTLETADSSPAAADAKAQQGGNEPAPQTVQAVRQGAGEAANAVAAGQTMQPADLHAELVVLGAGPGGYTAAFRAADLGKKVVLVERYPTLGGVCLNVGCIPSKALLHAAKVITEAEEMTEHGISFAPPQIDLARLRDWKSRDVVGKLTGGLGALAKQRNVTVINGRGEFSALNQLQVTGADGKVTTIAFDHAIIAAGSQAAKMPGLAPEHQNDPRIMDSTGALALEEIPKRMLVVGGGIIGLEMATVYATLGTQIDVVELGPGLMPGADRDLVKVWEKMNLPRFNRVMLNTKCVAAKADASGIAVQFEGANGAVTPDAGTYDRVLVAVGRSPNGGKLGADKAGVIVDERGFIKVDNQMRTNVPHIFAIGDLVGQPMLAHKAVHEGHVAAEVAAGHKRVFDPLQI
ncbi:MAG: dihydrolipoyl dehydrogenase, partial [Methylobacterium sp.]|nr:dihydrolipoyl dehydrogenase [Methylobacterium sp.]